MMDPQKVRAALRAALGAPLGSAEIAAGVDRAEPDVGEAEAAARLLAEASPARLGLLALEIAASASAGDKPGDKPAYPAAIAALKFAHMMRSALLAEMGGGSYSLGDDDAP